ncbi:hypothetical protein ACFQZX_08860 [Mucilaginibacter litoreus]|uniref:Uncharacterized protein n=1 Tax=Mucilaginibacter litoreus TaxID=1048221 RepID=A0ABW3AT73_9SPHI
MKKQIAIACLCICTILTACGGSNNPEDNDTSSVTTDTMTNGHHSGRGAGSQDTADNNVTDSATIAPPDTTKK